MARTAEIMMAGFARRSALRCIRGLVLSQESLPRRIWIQQSTVAGPCIRVWEHLTARQLSPAATEPSSTVKEFPARAPMRPIVDIQKLLSHDSWKNSQVGRLLTAVGATEEDLVKIREKNPFVFLAPDAEGPGGVVRWFETGLGINGPELTEVLTKYPAVLSRPVDVLDGRVKWLTEELGIDSAVQLKPLVIACPRIFEDPFQRRFMDGLEFLDKMKLDRSAVGEMAFKFPAFLTLATKDRLMTFCKLMWKVPGLKVSSSAKILRREPRVLSRSSESMTERMRYLMFLGLRRVDIATLVEGHPQVLGYCLETMVQPLVSWLEKLGLRKKHICEAIMQRPQILGAKVDSKIKRNYEFMRIKLNFSVKEIEKMLKLCPVLIVKGLQDENVEAKLRFLTLGLKRSRRELLDFPNYLTYSLEDRLIPRALFLQSNRMREFRTWSLMKLYRESDRRFCLKIKKELKDYEEYRQKWQSTGGPYLWLPEKEDAGTLGKVPTGVAPSKETNITAGVSTKELLD